MKGFLPSTEAPAAVTAGTVPNPAGPKRGRNNNGPKIEEIKDEAPAKKDN
jgi:hypothetical protein